ncbi:MAG: cob(I)yrinic acid a,c-diamide adenosyltransferase, partial [Myxococcales bacterium]|nr:cob(I)yrinic acid a,c-diamide adenosyltransferase [Myxococcales bacterium]
QKVPKDHLRIEAYGTIDELNAILGIARVFNLRETTDVAVSGEIDVFLRTSQNNLFNLGSDLATRVEDRWPNMPLIGAADVTALETLIDRWNNDLFPLNSFVLPGGNPVSAFLHQARTVCRRAERCILRLSREEQIGEYVLSYVNRFSDALFVASRWATIKTGASEFLWER